MEYPASDLGTGRNSGFRQTDHLTLGLVKNATVTKLTASQRLTRGVQKCSHSKSGPHPATDLGTGQNYGIRKSDHLASDVETARKCPEGKSGHLPSD